MGLTCPVGESGSGFVNAIEVFSAPKDFILEEGAKLLYFDVYLNEYSAYNDLDLSSLTFHVLSSPMYMDFIVDSDDLGAVRVSVGPSAVSSLNKVNAILNGVEIMKMVNPSHSQSGSKKISVWIVVASGIGVFVLCLVVFVAILACKYKKRKPRPRRVESAGWTPLRVYGELRTPRIAPQAPSINTETETDSGDGPSEIRNSQVFSQLMTNDGR
ncbi:hypothetical protein OIU76_027835 [Salix suchowensis]|nr:hypothetical protein OIU76_027835 [Salix suchowensis]